MDVTSWLLRRTAPRVLLLTAPGGTGARLAVERFARERGWRLAMSPAEANTVIVAGDDHRFEEHVRQVWDTVPAPRVRVDVATAADAEHELDTVLGMLHDTARQRAEAARAASPVQTAHAEHVAEDGHGDHDEHAAHEDHQPHGGHEPHNEHGTHEGHESHADHGSHGDHGGSGHMGHGGHDHHMSGMELPGGLPMADRAEDRDGLTLDQLHVPLGPALPLWPAGLIVHTRLQGDVIQRASVELLAAHHDSFWSHHPAARRLDSCYRLLALAGWEDAATTAQRLRDDALSGDVPDVRRWASRVRRSRTLRWLLSGVGVTTAGDDALDRLHRWLDSTTEPPSTRWTVDVLPALLEGAELGTARLIVASLDFEVHTAGEVHHG
ncbi:hypothetical protein [Actinophytocola sp. NPDC049390]|uniref:hypothetical protein n=1 Tax=Actinophytocola sp. NPDC049390 TaxID=3363894 RepID=UPI0037A8D36C